MSGLLPRNSVTQESATYGTLNVGDLTVDGNAYLGNMVVGSQTVLSVKTSTVLGNPNLAVTAGSVTINGSPLVTASSSDTFTNKTIDSATNTVLIDGTNVNILIDQAVTTTSGPTFGGLSIYNASVPMMVLGKLGGGAGATAGEIQFISPDTRPGGCSAAIRSIDNGSSTSDLEFLTAPNGGGTSAVPRLIIDANGISQDNTSSDVLCLSTADGVTLAKKTDLVDTGSTQTLTNKTLDSLSNTLSVDGTNINDLLGQDVRQTADVSFQAVTANGILTSANTLVVTGPKISPLPTSPMMSAGLDTLDAPRLQMWGADTGVLGSLTFGNLAGNSQYEGKLEYDGVTNSFNFYFAGSPSPFINFAASGATIGSSTIATEANSVVFSGKTIDSSANTIQISSSPISAVNINQLLNQDVRTTANPSFQTATFNLAANPFITISDGAARNGLIGVASNANGWFSGSSTGDLCISNRTNGAIRLGQGTGASPANLVLSTTACSIVPATTVPRLTQSNYSAVCRYNVTANALVTNVVVVGGFVNIVTSISLASVPLQNFNTNGNVGVTYTGSLSRRFLISYSVTINTSVSVGHSLQCTINGVSVPASVKSGHSHVGATAPSTTSCTWISLLAPNDQLQLQLANLTSTTDLLAERITFTLNELDF